MSQELKQELKYDIIDNILSGSDLIKKALKDNNDIVYSENYKTGKYVTPYGEFIRVNKDDIEKGVSKDLLNLMLAMDTSTIKIKDEDIESEYVVARRKAIEDGLTFNLDEEELFKEYKEKLIITDSEKEKEKAKEKMEEEFSEDLDKSKEKIDEVEEMTSSMKSTISDKLLKDSETDKQESMIGQVEASLDIEENLDDEVKDSRFFDPDEYKDIDFDHLFNLKNKLLKSFKGYNGKISSYSPSKRFNLKKDIVDKDNIYFKRKAMNGKHININFIVDMSGSMYGSPLRNTISILWLFNELAKEGYVSGNIIYTAENYSEGKLHKTFPMKDEEVLTIANAWGPVEGIASTAEEYKKVLRNSHTICITDGNITDVPVKKEFWDKLRVHTTGVYVKNAKSLDDLKKYKNNLLSYFHNGVVRTSLDDLIDWFLRFKIRSK